MMTDGELQEWADRNAEACLLFHGPANIRKAIADSIRDAYYRGVSEERSRRDQQDDEEAPPGMMVG